LDHPGDPQEGRARTSRSVIRHQYRGTPCDAPTDRGAAGTPIAARSDIVLAHADFASLAISTVRPLGSRRFCRMFSGQNWKTMALR
jgi:hypothetical protein